MKNYEKVEVLKLEHTKWRDENFYNKQGFFPVFSTFKEQMRSLSPGAITLFLYIGLHSNNQTGECRHSIETIAAFFDKSTRTISNWISELEEARLIVRVQLKFNGVSYTYLRPY
ncbi:hypothetical protein CEW92_18285 [Bacillaceae bacterium SAS-127]|nr:hypothetical protein CEW92_18285 [Bacillaceae bacterium SAS-127]